MEHLAPHLPPHYEDPDMPDDDTIQRLQRLERDLATLRRSRRRDRAGLLAMATAGTGVLMLAAGDFTAVDVLQVHRLEIIDEAGHLVLAASADDAGGRLDLWTNGGANVMRLGVNDHGGDMAIWNSAGVNVFGAYATGDGATAGLWSADGRPWLRLAGGQGAALQLLDDEATPALELVRDERGAALRTLDRTGATRLRLGLDGAVAGLDMDDGESILHLGADGLAMINRDGEPALRVGIDSDGSATLSIHNGEGRRVVSASADESGHGRLVVAERGGSSTCVIRASGEPGATIALTTPLGRTMLALASSDQGGLCNLMNERGVPVFIAGYARGTRGGALSVNNGRGVQVVSIAADQRERGVIIIHDEEGRRTRTIETRP